MLSLRERWTSALPRLLIMLHDLAMVGLCWQGLYWIRYNLFPAGPMPPFDLLELLVVLAVQGAVFHGVGLYRGLWRFASMPDLANLLKAAVLGLTGIVIGLFLYNRLEGVPRIVLVMYPSVLVALLGMPRLVYRAWKDSSQERSRESATRTLILGAGQAGEALVRDLLRSPLYMPVGLLDDAPRLRGTRVHGMPVLGRIDEAGDIARETAARLLVIAMPSLPADRMERVISICESTGLPFRMVPRLHDVLSGRSLPGELKEVAIEDLLGRESVPADWQAIRGWLGGRSVLVTGAGGSIGSELCRQCVRNGASQITLIEQDELSLMRMEQELARDFPAVGRTPILGDCGDPAVISHALRQADIEAVFHAAAYKQVPVLEGQLREALRNNALATETVARAAHKAGVGTFVLISTDKAVDPANVLGASKRLAESLCQLQARYSSTHFVTVRFGNVLDSAGSVVPLFREQIRLGGPVTVTHPEVTRFFMTIPESCQLILQAAAIGAHDAIYTLDMGEPVPIRRLAEQMIRLADKQPGRDIAIVYTGLRPGEKLHETLFHAEEGYRRTAHPKILQGEVRELEVASLQVALEGIRVAVASYDEAALARWLQQAVPEFSPAENDPADAGIIVPFPHRRSRQHRR
ncbi:polysaccharide biosynthesis protein [Lysobacter pythonis]|uniref:Polysaccharide biosynthesis protein n=1 Tax=Solilutibacter pythonis TaxID=2483112 RepID=A0A3M2I944_9GAMM|nr:nucleoside-diphosphate sugar epimerase/dehydratase [Lysobacter pythonis]RMH94987.1 polysaccharide biosynthesis protein [Lysobacter pythonis]